MAAEAGELCSQCWAGTLQLHEGMLVCDVCGSIHQGFAEEAQEYQTGISDARFFKKSEGMRGVGKAGAAAVEPPPPPPVREAVRAYVAALQALLQAQAATLVGSCGMHPGLSPVLRELWLAHLAATQLLEPTSLDRLQALAEAGGEPYGGGSSEDEEDPTAAARPRSGRGSGRAPRQMGHDRRSVRLEKDIGPKLRPQHTLALVLVACWQQGEAASPLDACRWTIDGHLPYLGFPAQQAAGLRQFGSVLSSRLFTPTGVPTPRYLLELAQQLAQQLGLACPPLSPALWVERYLAELELPAALLPLALQLHSVYQPAPLPPTAAWRAHRHPWARFMASLLLAVKLCYGLDGRGQVLPPGLAPAPDWQAWAQRQLARLGTLSAFPLTLAEAAQLDQPRLRCYLQYLQRGLFAAFAPPPDLEGVHQLLQRLALLNEEEERAEAGAGAGAAGWPAGDGGAAAAGTAGAGQQAAAGKQQQQQQEQGDAAAGTAEQAPGGAPAAGYLLYGTVRRRAGGAQRALFHPDYAMVLTACAPLVWLQPEALHSLLASEERSVAAAECELSFLYNAQEQARLARLREEAAWLARQREEAAAARREARRRQQEAAAAAAAAAAAGEGEGT
ncbi:TATA box-binding -associated factor RNA polymerase I subunit B [Micractinium conductrix]|uniref:TATA box-binding -associated factor RNA polymerase I subunit B n=1 Tax=Micractinium conductrix TaxID=554055 RepID=A0A2P6VP28_9CHLO|nr:TATA box-binding -associated factor RNA polymerase I subunit B [Micractinium conductrix]|eukprot:PSC75815.1 TATA box-binding -associated factor RNA polymerase I subunit B [Micractinium conductrix]